MGKPVVHFEIGAKDAAKLSDFYSQLFGWKISRADPIDYYLVETNGGSGIDGGIFPLHEGMSPFVTIYIESSELQADLDKAESLGGKTTNAPMPIEGVGEAAMFVDPDGNMIGLFHPMRQQS
jgi:hypothetical protein